jgi:hypothetical protein
MAWKRNPLSVENVTDRLLRIFNGSMKLGTAAGMGVARAALMDATRLNGLTPEPGASDDNGLQRLLDRFDGGH